MTKDTENLVLEHLKKIQGEQAAARERDQEILARLSSIEVGLACRSDRTATRIDFGVAV